MNSDKFELFPILPTNYRLEHLRRIERRYLSEKLSIPIEVENNRPILCSDEEEIINKHIPQFPELYKATTFNKELVDEITSKKTVRDLIRRLELEESAAKLEHSINDDPRGLYISEDIEQMMPINSFNDFNQFKVVMHSGSKSSGRVRVIFFGFWSGSGNICQVFGFSKLS